MDYYFFSSRNIKTITSFCLPYTKQTAASIIPISHLYPLLHKYAQLLPIHLYPKHLNKSRGDNITHSFCYLNCFRHGRKKKYFFCVSQTWKRVWTGQLFSTTAKNVSEIELSRADTNMLYIFPNIWCCWNRMSFITRQGCKFYSQCYYYCDNWVCSSLLEVRGKIVYIQDQ